MIIGLVGPMGAGKGIFAEYLGEKGFQYTSLSDEIRQEIKSRGLPESRELLTSIGNELRQQSGSGVLAQRILKRLVPGTDYVVDSIRNPEEVKTLQVRKDFVLIKIDSPAEVRFERIRDRGRTGDVQTIEQFLHQEQAEAESKDETRQQIRATAAMADDCVLNDSTKEVFYQRIDALLSKLTGRQ